MAGTEAAVADADRATFALLQAGIDEIFAPITIDARDL